MVLNQIVNSFKSVQSESEAAAKFRQALLLVKAACEGLDNLGMSLNQVSEGKGTPLLGVSSLFNKALEEAEKSENDIKNFLLSTKKSDRQIKTIKIRQLENYALRHPSHRVRSHLNNMKQLIRASEKAKKIKERLK